MTTNKGNPYHRKGGKGGGQFTKQSDQGITNATDNQRERKFGKDEQKRANNKLKPPKEITPGRGWNKPGQPKDQASVPDKRQKGNWGGSMAGPHKRPKALPLEKEIIVGEGASPAVEDNPVLRGDRERAKAKQAMNSPETVARKAAGIKYEQQARNPGKAMTAKMSGPGTFTPGMHNYEFDKLQREAHGLPAVSRDEYANLIRPAGAPRIEEAARKAAGLPRQIIKGDYVEFANPNPDEVHKSGPLAGQSVRMKVLEINGDRALVESQVDMAIKPTQTISLKDLKFKFNTAEDAGLPADGSKGDGLVHFGGKKKSEVNFNKGLAKRERQRKYHGR